MKSLFRTSMLPKSWEPHDLTQSGLRVVRQWISFGIRHRDWGFTTKKADHYPIMSYSDCLKQWTSETIKSWLQANRKFFFLPYALQPLNPCNICFYPLCFAWTNRYCGYPYSAHTCVVSSSDGRPQSVFRHRT